MRLGFPSAIFLKFQKIPGGNTDGETPLPIPNREVKPIRADGTVLVTARESRSLPGFFICGEDFSDISLIEKPLVIESLENR